MDAKYVGRPTIWGNPYAIGKDGDRATVLREYESYLANWPFVDDDLEELRGKDLVCWCAPMGGISPDDELICHAQILMRRANRGTVF